MGLEHWLCSRTARHWKMLAAARLRSRSLSFTSTTEDGIFGLGTAYARRGSASIEEHRLGLLAGQRRD